MSKSSKAKRDAMAARLMTVLLSRLDHPIDMRNPVEEELDSSVFDEDWTLFKDFHPEEFDKKPGPATVDRLKATVSGTSSISIRVPNRILQAFRRQADKTGVPYQTLINRALDKAADAIN